MVYYFDATALGSSYAVNEQDNRWWEVHEFELRGWRVDRKDKSGEKLAESEVIGLPLS